MPTREEQLQDACNLAAHIGLRYRPGSTTAAVEAVQASDTAPHHQPSSKPRPASARPATRSTGGGRRDSSLAPDGSTTQKTHPFQQQQRQQQLLQRKKKQRPQSSSGGGHAQPAAISWSSLEQEATAAGSSTVAAATAPPPEGTEDAGTTTVTDERKRFPAFHLWLQQHGGGSEDSNSQPPSADRRAGSSSGAGAKHDYGSAAAAVPAISSASLRGRQSLRSRGKWQRDQSASPSPASLTAAALQQGVLVCTPAVRRRPLSAAPVLPTAESALLSSTTDASRVRRRWRPHSAQPAASSRTKREQQQQLTEQRRLWPVGCASVFGTAAGVAGIDSTLLPIAQARAWLGPLVADSDDLSCAGAAAASNGSNTMPQRPSTSAVAARTGRPATAGVGGWGWAASISEACENAAATAAPTPLMWAPPGFDLRGSSSRQRSPSPGGGTAGLLDKAAQLDTGSSLHALLMLWSRLPLPGREPVGREGLVEITAALDAALAEAGAPAPPLHAPSSGLNTASNADDAGSGTAAVVAAAAALAEEEQEHAKWSAAAQLRPELVVWDRCLRELCRQISVECTDRGALLMRAVLRQRQLLSDALRCCEELWGGAAAGRREVAAGRLALAEVEAERAGLLQLMDDLKVCYLADEDWAVSMLCTDGCLN